MQSSEQALQQALALHQAGRHAEAAHAYQSVLALKPDFADAYYHFGRLMRELGHTEHAFACYRRAVECNAGFAPAFRALGQLFAEQKQFDAAISVQQAAIALSPADPQPYVDMGQTLVDAERTLEAVDVSLRAIPAQWADAYEQRKRAGAFATDASTAPANASDPNRKFFPTVEGLLTEIESRRMHGDLEGALSLIQHVVKMCINDRRSVAKIFADARLDAACQRIGADCAARLPAVEPAQAAQTDCVVLVTELWWAGGHTAALEDLLETKRFGERIVILHTDLYDRPHPEVAATRFGAVATAEIAPKGGLADKLAWTLKRLRELRPKRLIVMNHHDDAAAIAAAQPSVAEETIYYHHCDHHLALGVTLAHAVHVDISPMAWHNCRDALGIEKRAYWPLTAHDLGARTGGGWMVDGNLRTCSSGSSLGKFEHAYRYAYADVVPRIMACTGGLHVHIGPLSEFTLARIRGSLNALGIPPQRFVHVPRVRSVWQAFDAFKIDVMLASFPLGGGKVLIEAMGSGTPAIGHDCYISPFFSGREMFYPGAFMWQHPDELLAHLRGLTAARLEDESRVARARFEQFHTLDALTRAIDGGADTPAVPDMLPLHTDPLQMFLDDAQYAEQDYRTLAPYLR